MAEGAGAVQDAAYSRQFHCNTVMTKSLQHFIITIFKFSFRTIAWHVG